MDEDLIPLVHHTTRRQLRCFPLILGSIPNIYEHYFKKISHMVATKPKGDKLHKSSIYCRAVELDRIIFVLCKHACCICFAAF